MCLLCRRCMWARRPCARWMGFTSTAHTARVSKPSTKQESAHTARPWSSRHLRVRHCNSSSPTRSNTADTHAWGPSSTPKLSIAIKGTALLVLQYLSNCRRKGKPALMGGERLCQEPWTAPELGPHPFPLQKVLWGGTERDILKRAV